MLTSLSSGQCGPKELLGVFRNHWRVENSLQHVKDRSWDEDVHTLRRPGLGEVYATLVNTALNALRLEGWFPRRMSLPLRAKACAFRPTLTIPAFMVKPPDFAIVLLCHRRILQISRPLNSFECSSLSSKRNPSLSFSLDNHCSPEGTSAECEHIFPGSFVEDSPILAVVHSNDFLRH